MANLTPPETEAILTVCLTAAFADGEKHDEERCQIKDLTVNLAGSEIDLPALHQRVLLARPVLSDAVRPLTTLASRRLPPMGRLNPTKPTA